MAVELVMVERATTTTLLLLTVLAFVDVITGISLAVRRKQRARVVLEDEDHGHM
jgi:hypothetical protein